MDTRKWFAAGLAGAAFVAGGFVAGTLTETPSAEAVTADLSGISLAQEVADDTATDPAPAFGRRGPGHGHRGGGFGLGGDIAEELDIDTEAFRESLGDGATVAEALEAQGVSAEEATVAIKAEMEEHLAEAVADERLTQEEADDRLADADERIAAMLGSTPANKAFARNHPVAAHGIGEVADILGLEASEVADALRDGQSLAEIAEDNGVSRTDLVSQLVDAATERIEEFVDRVPGMYADA